MTQTASAPPATAPPPGQVALQQPSASTATFTPAATSTIQAWFAGTPGRMRALLILTAVMAVLFGLAAAQGFQQSDGALQRAEANTAQLVRVQAIHTSLVSANADATNAFLVGGLEPPAQRQHFVDSMTTASKLVAEAATAQPADQQALGELNATLLTYQGLIEQARANNRQGLPIGSQYLKDANASLQNDSLPLVSALVKANEERVSTEFDGVSRGNIWLLVGGLLTLVVLGFTMIWLAKRTHRYVNLPLAFAGVLVLLTMLVGGTSLASASGSAKDTRSHSYADTLAMSRARIAAYDAKSNESLTLIARGSGAAFEKDWVDSAKTVDDQLAIVAGTAPQAQQPWTAYKANHTEIRKLDDGGNWDQAVPKAIAATGTSANTTFAAFDTATSKKLTDFSTATRGELTDARNGLPPIGWLGIPIGIVAALLAAWGLSQRLGEYR
ncbi:MAG TPA: hypothetical protein VFG33_17955 [Kribbella sp.]|uniref:hypothetical protein n=1 Tax=Kribbella sp. TaxID=1871183 RepID=UPI002D78B3E4|nr:hypothetical protein [Kribbella sp.]HET6295275.1 hypothetical protein [Kribbella sp.]